MTHPFHLVQNWVAHPCMNAEYYFTQIYSLTIIKNHPRIILFPFPLAFLSCHLTLKIKLTERLSHLASMQPRFAWSSDPSRKKKAQGSPGIHVASKLWVPMNMCPVPMKQITRKHDLAICCSWRPACLKSAALCGILKISALGLPLAHSVGILSRQWLQTDFTMHVVAISVLHVQPCVFFQCRIEKLLSFGTGRSHLFVSCVKCEQFL